MNKKTSTYPPHPTGSTALPDTERATNVLLIAKKSGDVSFVMEVGQQSLSKLLKMHEQSGDFPMQLLEREADLTNVAFRQNIYKIKDARYFRSLIGAFVLLSYAEQIQLGGLADQLFEFYLVVNY